MNLFFGITIAPYGVDLCNALHERYNCRILHLEQDAPGLAFDVKDVETLCRFPFDRYAGRPGIRSFRMLARLIREERPETVFVSEFSLTTLGVLLISRFSRHRFRVVSFCDDSLDMIRGNDFSRLHRLARRIVPRWLDQLVLANPDSLAWYRAHFGKGVMMPIMADEKRLRKDAEAALPLAGQLREQWDLGKTPVVLFVGRLIPLKNLNVLLSAMQGIPATVVFVGEGEEESFLRQRAAELGVRALFVGRKAGLELSAWYDLADLLVLPSLQEAFGAVTGEALSAGCPALVSSRAGSSFLVREGERGAVIDPGDIPALSAALRTWLSQVQPGRPLVLRPNLMPVSFSECFEKMLSSL